MTIPSPSTQRVIIIGGGISGLAAAREFSKDPNVHVTLLEARNRLGGRIVTNRNLIPKDLETSGQVPAGSSNLVYDFGASWIHGVDPSNPLYAIAQTGQMEYVHTDSDVMFFRPGEPAVPAEESDHLWQVVWDILDRAQEFSAEHRDSISEGKSFKEWLSEYLDSMQSTDPEGENYLAEDVKKWVPGLAHYWADENAIPLDQVSMKYMDAEKIFPGDHSLVINGFDRAVKVVTAEVKKNVRVLLEHVVEKIEYDETEILLFFPTCFWPLHKHFINFLPSALTIPAAKLIAHFELNARQVEALTVYMQDLANYSSLMPQYNIPILVGYATNRAAELMERLSDEEARMVYLCQMAHYFPILTQEDKGDGELVGKALWPTVSFMSRWNQDPFARGSYTSIPIHATPQDLEAFDIPIGARSYGALSGEEDEDDNTTVTNGGSTQSLKSVDDAENGRIFFAGEHTSPNHFASVHGALLTGQREAAKILGQHFH
ncbi:hypothetical protein BGX29_000379 [Mortierella sp. GBA35]|nr:hypothetical protein BGX29_000379 [Mortierella sp. GBA35]